MKNLGHAVTIAVSIAVLMVFTQGCGGYGQFERPPSEAEGKVYEWDYRVDSSQYPVFAVKVPHPHPNPNYIISDFTPQQRWQVTHIFQGRYLVFSEEFDQASCIKQYTEDSDGSQANAIKIKEKCSGREPDFWSGWGERIMQSYVNIQPDGTAYGWTDLMNPSAEYTKDYPISDFKVDATGDWSGQPWFECVARCDKLVNMKNKVVIPSPNNAPFSKL